MDSDIENKGEAAEQKRTPSGWGKLIAAGVLALVSYLVVIVVAAVLLTPQLVAGYTGNMGTGVFGLASLAGGIASMLFIVLLGGKRIIRPSLDGADFALRASAVVLVVNVGLTLFSVFGELFSGTDVNIRNDWLMESLILAAMCAGVGLVEEGCLRGLLLNGLLARMGTSLKGVVWAVFISSAVFGLVHVLPLDSDAFSPTGLLQVVLKTLQAGMFGFVMAVIYLKTKNLWLSVLVHGLSDYLLLVYDVAIRGYDFTTDYVVGGQDALTVIVMYVFVIVVYLPSFVYCARELKKMRGANRGAFWK